jgi:DNA replication protein DnaC
MQPAQLMIRSARSPDDVLDEAAELRTAEPLARTPGRAAVRAKRAPSQLARLVASEREKLERAADHLRERIRYANAEVREQTKALEEQAARATPEVARRVLRRIAAVRAEFGECDEKLVRACDLAREAIRPKTT